MTCNHDIAYLVRNANARVQSGAALGTPVRPRAQHTPTCCRHEVVFVKREIQITICLLQTRSTARKAITRVTRMRAHMKVTPVPRPCARHVATPIRNKYMHAAKHVHGLIPNSLEAKHVNTHVKSRYTCRCHHHPKGHFHRTRNKCKREYVLLEVALHDIAIRKIRFGLPKSGNTKVVLRKRFIDMIMWIPNNGLDAI